MPVHQISQLGLVNAYLVAKDDGLTLVDAMVPRTHKKILAAAAGLGAPIHRIALTHAHGDHIGALDAHVAALPGVEVLISTRDARLLAGDKSLDPGEPQTKLRGGYPGAKTRRTRTLEHGDRVGSLEAHAGPGHARAGRVPGPTGLTGDEQIHAARALRSAVHGFAALETAGGFGVAVGRDVSFRRLVDALAAGIA